MLVDSKGEKIEMGLVSPSGISFKDLKEIEPKALSDFVVCEVVEVSMETSGGILISRGDGQPFRVNYVVHSMGPELQMNKPNQQLFKGDRIMPISPEVIKLPGSHKNWAIFHESQIKAVIVEVDSAESNGEKAES